MVVAESMMAVRYGAPAPEFALPSTEGGELALASFRGRTDVVLVFYCYDWGRI